MKYLTIEIIYMHENVINLLYHGFAHARAIMHNALTHAHALSDRTSHNEDLISGCYVVSK